MTSLEHGLSDTLDHTIYLGNRSFKHLSIGLREPQKVCLAPLLVRALHKAHAINLLVKEGLFEEAQTILRVLIEVSFVMRAIQRDEEFAAHYGRSAFVQKEAYIKAILKGDVELKGAFLNDSDRQRMQADLGKLGKAIKHLGARKISVRDYAVAADLTSIYYTTYSELSSTVHSGPEDLERFFDIDEATQVLKIGNPKEGRKDILFWVAIETMLRVLQDCEATFGLCIIGLDKVEKVYRDMSSFVLSDMPSPR